MANIPDLSDLVNKIDIKGVVKTVKAVVDPERVIPVDEEKNPINYRIVRIRGLIASIRKEHKRLNQEISGIETQLTALLEDLNQTLIDQHVEGNFKQASEDKKTKPAAKKRATKPKNK